MENSGLKRVLGLPAVTLIAVGFMIGGGVFVFTGLALKITGQGLPLAYGLAVIPVFISMMPMAMLGSALPVTGANYKYASRMVSPGLAFVGIWVYLLASFFGQIPLYALGCAKYAQAINPSIPPTLFAVLVVTFFYVVNILGLKLAAQVEAVLVFVLIAALVYYSFKGLSGLNVEYLRDLTARGSGSLLLAVALLTFTYFGANGIIELGGEIIDPGKTIPRAFFIAFPIVAVVYVSVALATVGVMPVDKLIELPEPLISVSRSICSPGGAIFFIIGGAVLALITTLNALFMVGTKSLLMIIQDGLFPESLGRLNKRFGTPHVLLTCIWILSIAGIVSGLSLETLASYAALGGLIIFLPIQLASLRLPSLYPDQYKNARFKLKGFWFWFCPIVGMLMVLFFSIVLIVDLKSPVKIGCFVLFIISGVVYYILRKSALKTKGQDLGLLVKEKWGV